MFKTLKSLGFVVEVIGWIIGVLSMIFFLTALVTFLQNSRSFGGGLALASLLPSLGGILIGIYFVVTGQAIRCFVAIEENTRETNRLLQSGRTEKKAEVIKKAAAGSMLGLTSAESAAETEVRRISDMEKQKTSVSCPKCGKTYPINSRGQFCEDCGAKL